MSFDRADGLFQSLSFFSDPFMPMRPFMMVNTFFKTFLPQLP